MGGKRFPDIDFKLGQAAQITIVATNLLISREFTLYTVWRGILIHSLDWLRFGVYVMATSKVISVQVLTCDSVHSW